MMFGTNPASDLILATLGLTREDVGRFRDAFIADGEVAVYTRNGGGNREHYDYDKDLTAGVDCRCTGCVMSDVIPRHPLYLRDEDDDFDSTYATIYYRIPDDHAELLRGLDTGDFQPDERWLSALEQLRARDPATMEKLAPLATMVSDAIAKAKGGAA